MAGRATADAPGAASGASDTSAFLSPVSKYNKLREDELRAQQERLKSVRVDRKSASLVGKRKLENAGGSADVVGVRASPAAVTFADASAPSFASSHSVTARAGGTSSKAAALTASLAKKKQRRTAPSSSASGRSSTDSSGSRRGSGDGKSISGILKNYMKKVEAEKRDPAAATTTLAAETKRHLTYDAMTQILSTPPTRITTTTTSNGGAAAAVSTRVHLSDKKLRTGGAMQSPEMFSRAVDASFHKTSALSSSALLVSSATAKPARTLKHFDSLAVTKNKLERQRDANEAARDAASGSSVFAATAMLPKRSARLVTSVTDEAVVDLEHVENVASLETVEGSAILQALMSTGTPRAGRAFPSERAQPASDERDRAFLQRRHLALRKKYTAVPDTAPAAVSAGMDDVGEDKWTYTESSSSSGTIVIERKRASGATAARKLDVGSDDRTVDGTDMTDAAGLEETDPSASERTVASATATATSAAAAVNPDDESDKETTASKIARISAVKRASWRMVVARVVIGALLLCAVVLALPSLKVLFTPSLPFCDTDAHTAIVSMYDFDRSRALQPYTGSASSSSSPEVACRVCPVFGNCSNGALQSCVAPYELVHSACVENPDVRYELQHLAGMIRDFVVAKASESLQNVSLWDALVSGRTLAAGAAAVDYATPVQILLSDLHDALAGTIAYGKALAKLPREYVFNRALDLALRDLRDIFYVRDSSALLVAKSVAPWPLQAKLQLYAHARVIAGVVLLCALLAHAYRFAVVRRIERSLIDRLVKEVRFALLQRTAHPDKWYPADYLRDDLFDILPHVTPQDRKWLRESVWPRVMAIVEDDSRVRSSTKTVSGDTMIVWEWIPVASPAKAPTTLASAKQALVKLAGGGRRRAKASRKSFPM